LNIDLKIDNRTKEKIPAVKTIKQAILDTLKEKNVNNDIIVGLKVVGKSEIQKLNNEYRQINKPTDVLSFPIYEVTPKIADHPLLLGDIIVCPQCAQDDILFLVQHSILHLLGYHHK
jgi:probable rRNA maturation factor